MARRLTKSNDNIVFTGTLAGIGEYLGISPTSIRLLYVLLSFYLIGCPILMHILLALFIPSGFKKNYAYKSDNSYEQPSYYNEKNNQKNTYEKEVDEEDWTDF